MCRPFSCNTSSGPLKSSGERDRLSFSFINIYVAALTERIHCSEAALLFAESTTFMFLCRVNSYRAQTEQDGLQVPQRHQLYINCSIFGQGRNLEEPLPLFFLASKIRLLPDFKFSVSEGRSN
jgi:hypothetical protein